MRWAPFRWTLAAAALLAMVTEWHVIRTLHVQLDGARTAERRALQMSIERDAIIERLLRDAREKDAQRAQLERMRAAIDSTLAAYQKAFRRLIDENKTVRTWAGTALPDDVVRLHSCPAITGAKHYTERMRTRVAVHDAVNGAAHER
ncbi:LysB family phage lysis regulatory protein [Mycetohabitans sp. B46]